MSGDRDGPTNVRGGTRESYKERLTSAVSWSVAGQIVSQTLQVGIGIVLARALSPREFGMIGMIGVFTAFSVLLANMGFGSALVQIDKLEDRHLNSIFWLNVMAGAVLAVSLFFAAPYIASFYGHPELKNLSRACAPTLFLQLTTVVPIALRNRSLNFKSLVVMESVAGILGGGVAISLAIGGFGAYSLIAQSLAAAVTSSTLLWRNCTFRPSLGLDRSAVRQLFGFSSRLFGFQFMNYWMRNADNLLIGKFVGADALGAYSRAYMWMLMPVAQVSQVVSRVMFPALSRVQHDLPRVKRYYLRTISAIALLTFPAMLGLTVVTDLFVSTLLGDNWLDVIPLLQVLGVVGMMQSIGTTTGLIYQSLGRTDLLLRWGIGSGLVTLTAFVIGLRWGALGVATAYAIRSAALVYWNYSIPGRLIDMKVREVFNAARGVFGCALLMCLPVLALRELLPHDWPRALRLGLCVTSGAICYLVLVLTTKPAGYADLRELVMSRLGTLRRRAAPAPSAAP